MRTNGYLIGVLMMLAVEGGVTARSQQSGSPAAVSHDGHTMPEAGGHEHGAAVPAITYAELEQTTQRLSAARRATEKYQDVRTAEAAGYRPVGPDVPGMGIHYVLQGDHPRFSITEPPILLYERDAAGTLGLRLVGVSYLLVAPADTDEQPTNPPFPRALASWHKHNNVCVLPDNGASISLTQSECTGRGGRFTAETSWMVHAWIWKDSPTGVFSPTNPLVK
jgi:hypothetical protein